MGLVRRLQSEQCHRRIQRTGMGIGSRRSPDATGRALGFSSPVTRPHPPDITHRDGRGMLIAAVRPLPAGEIRPCKQCTYCARDPRYRRCRTWRRGLGRRGRGAVAQTPPADDPWPSLATQIFDGRHLEDGSAIIGIDAPYRAEDAAVVPIGIHDLQPDGAASAVSSITW